MASWTGFSRAPPTCGKSLSASMPRPRRRTGMTDVSRDQEAIDAARGLTEAVQGTAGELAAMRRELAAMNTYGKHNRRLIAGLAISFALDLLLTVIVAVFAIQAHDASSQAHVAASLAAQNHA